MIKVIIAFDAVKTTKNKDSSKHYVCSTSGCYSLKILDEVVTKVNGKKVKSELIELSHTNHGPYKNEEIISINFERAFIEKITQESSL
jgi:hypothetical protein